MKDVMVCVACVPLWHVSGVWGSVRFPCKRDLASEELGHEGSEYDVSGAHLVGRRAGLRGIDPLVSCCQGQRMGT